MSNMFLLGLTFVIGLISVYDTYLSIIYSPQLRQSEQNPLGIYLLDVGGLELFITTKAVATILSIICCVILIKTKYKLAIVGVLAFQFLLFFYLNFYTHSGISFDSNNSPLIDFFNYIFNLDHFIIDPFPKEYTSLPPIINENILEISKVST
mgnify:CR=1 FL=1